MTPAGPMGTPALPSSSSGAAAATSSTSVNDLECSSSAYCSYAGFKLRRNVLSSGEAIPTHRGAKLGQADALAATLCSSPSVGNQRNAKRLQYPYNVSSVSQGAARVSSTSLRHATQRNKLNTARPCPKALCIVSRSPVRGLTPETEGGGAKARGQEWVTSYSQARVGVLRVEVSMCPPTAQHTRHHPAPSDMAVRG